MWLAALRETDKQDPTEQHLICEDHFLPEDITKNGVHSDAIPIMPPCFDGAWGAESEEERCFTPEEENIDESDDVDDDDGGGGSCKAEVLPVTEPPQQVRAFSSSLSFHSLFLVVVELCCQAFFLSLAAAPASPGSSGGDSGVDGCKVWKLLLVFQSTPLQRRDSVMWCVFACQ